MKTSKAEKLLLLIEMSVDQAFGVLGINPKSFKADELKDYYRKASIKHHPDKGGDVEMMKKVNIAYDLLKTSGVSSAGGSRVQDYDWKAVWKETQKQDKINSKLVIQVLRNSFNPVMYQEYFEKISGIKLDFVETEKVSFGYYDRYIRFGYEFSNPTKETVFKFLVHVDLSRVNFTKALGAGDGSVDFDYRVEHYVYHNKRQQKMKKRTSSLKSAVKDIVSPEKLFPKATLHKIFAGKKQRKFSKRDFIEGLKREVKGKVDRKYIWIPLADNFIFIIYRMTFQKLGFWMPDGIYSRSTGRLRRVSTLKTATFAEDEHALNFIIDLAKKMKKKSTLEDIVKEFEIGAIAYKKFKEN